MAGSNITTIATSPANALPPKNIKTPIATISHAITERDHHSDIPISCNFGTKIRTITNSPGIFVCIAMAIEITTTQRANSIAYVAWLARPLKTLNMFDALDEYGVHIERLSLISCKRRFSALRLAFCRVRWHGGPNVCYSPGCQPRLSTPNGSPDRLVNGAFR